MSGIYLHIPFCRQACHYCDFHFSTSMKHKEALLKAMHQELHQRRAEMGGTFIETVYFGGGTPSLLTEAEIDAFLRQIGTEYSLSPDAEITLEANPDDLSPERIAALAVGPVNRLSIGIQSFTDHELRWMNRAHSADEALRCLETVVRHFDNYSIDLIYGIPGSRPETWQQTLQTALGFNPPHISAYALTVEPATALQSKINRGLSADTDEDRTEADFRHLVDTLEGAGYAHYEISNFGKPGYYSRNNTAYWLGKPYLGIGPSAHSYDGARRRWNAAHNLKYIRALEGGDSYFETETLSGQDRYNEAVMTGLRTEWGVDLQQLANTFGDHVLEYLRKQAGPHVEQGMLRYSDGRLLLTSKGKFLADGIASDLFMITLK